nr:DUF3363 domain-containing protein [Cupriavidus pauculus]
MLDDGMGLRSVPWWPVIEQRLGQQLAATARGGGVSWETGRQRGVFTQQSSESVPVWHPPWLVVAARPNRRGGAIFGIKHFQYMLYPACPHNHQPHHSPAAGAVHASSMPTKRSTRPCACSANAATPARRSPTLPAPCGWPKAVSTRRSRTSGRCS